MKKIFATIGVLIAIFSIFFFLMIADKMVYYGKEPVYSFSLSKNISGNELEEYAKKSNVTIKLVEFKNTSFGNNDLIVKYINPESNIKFGKKPSVFPKDNIIYKPFEEEKNQYIKTFIIQSNEYKGIINIRQLLEKNDYKVNLDITKPINFNFGMLFSTLNLNFFLFLTLLLIISIATYYIYRLKEIGILKLIGWSNKKISFNLLARPLIHLYLFSLILTIPFSIYVLLSDISKFYLYIKIYFLLCLFLVITFCFSALVGVFFVKNINRIGALKNNKNNKLIFYMLMVFKLIIVTLLTLSLNKIIIDLNNINSNINSIEKLQKYDFSRIQTVVEPEDSLHEYLDKILGRLDDSQIFNYSPSDSMIDSTKLKSYQSNNKLRSFNEIIYTTISSNLLDIINIFDENGKKINIGYIEENDNTLLVPMHFKDNIKTILNYYQFEKEPKIIYIQNGQSQENILSPGYYIYDSVYYIKKLEKVLYLNQGEVLLNKESAQNIQNKLINLGISENSLTIVDLKSDYDNLKQNFKLEFYESLFYVIINLLSFLICIISIVIIFLELRKKEFGVYKLIGKFPIKIVKRFIISNSLITIIIITVINPSLLFLLIGEYLIYGILIGRYVRNKVILAIKGE